MAPSSSSSRTDVDYTDPALDYLSTGWEMMYVTACKLYNFPDKEAPAGSQIQPEVAAGLPVVSNGGKTYTIKLKNTFKFSDGSKVTASSFVDAFNRNANPKLQSPSTPFMDVIAGLQAVVDGKATKISGVIGSERDDARDQPDQAGAGPRLAPHDAVLPGDPEEPRQQR